jgi:hypothetical protein
MPPRPRAYGGTWIENVIQAAARDVFYAAMKRLEAAGYAITLHVHDEVVAEVPEDFGSVEEFKRILLEPPSWASGLPLGAKARESLRFCKSKSVAKTENTPESISGTVFPSDDDESSPSPRPPTPEPAHICVQCHLDPPDGSERPSAYNGLWLHERCEDNLIQARMAEEGMPWSTAPTPPPSSSQDEVPEPSLPDDPSPRGNGGTTWADEDYGAGEQPLGAPTATYIYQTATGAPFIRVVRTTDHQFPTDHWENGRWVKGWPTRPFLPYRLPELLAAAANVPVFVPEGEKDCERLVALDLIATCNSGGASKSKDPAKSKWWPELNQHFAGKQLVYVLEDNDEPGRLLGDAKINALTPIVSEVVRVRFPELREGGDVSDWLDQLNPRTARATLEARCAQARKQNTTCNYVLVRASDIVPRAMDWLWSGHIARGSQELLTGIPGGGKSQIHCALVAAATTGGMWPDGCNGIPPGNVIMLTAEDCLDQTIVPRLIAAGADRARVHILKKIRKDNKERMFLLSEDLEQLEVMIRKVGNVWLITIDPITAYMGSKIDSHRHRCARAARAISRPGRAGRCCALGHHPSAQALEPTRHRPLHRLAGVHRRRAHRPYGDRGG